MTDGHGDPCQHIPAEPRSKTEPQQIQNVLLGLENQQKVQLFQLSIHAFDFCFSVNSDQMWFREPQIQFWSQRLDRVTELVMQENQEFRKKEKVFTISFHVVKKKEKY